MLLCIALSIHFCEYYWDNIFCLNQNFITEQCVKLKPSWIHYSPSQYALHIKKRFPAISALTIFIYSFKNVKVNGAAKWNNTEGASMKNGINNFFTCQSKLHWKEDWKIPQMVQLDWIGDLHLKIPLLWSWKVLKCDQSSIKPYSRLKDFV